MKVLVVCGLFGVCGVFGLFGDARGQMAPHNFAIAQDSARAIEPSWSVKRVAKWGTLLASTGAVVYGFAENRSADREYEAIERLCEDSPAQCATAADTDRYLDAELEARYQSVLKRDDRAKVALVAGQVGLAASVLLFILDLPEGSSPDDIPYDPRPLQLGIRADRLHLGLRFLAR